MTKQASVPRTAKYQARRRGDSWAVDSKFEELYDIDQTAAVLALTSSTEPDNLRPTTVLRLTRNAATAANPLTGEQALADADPHAVAEYRHALLRLGAFTPDPSVDPPGHVDPDQRKKIQIYLIVKIRGGREVIVRTVTRPFNFDEAAAALALQLPRQPPHFGAKTIQDALRAAAADRVTDDELAHADPRVTRHYRNQLINYDIFPPSARQQPAQNPRSRPTAHRRGRGRVALQLRARRRLSRAVAGRLPSTAQPHSPAAAHQ